MDAAKKNELSRRPPLNKLLMRATLSTVSITLLLAGTGCSKEPGEKEPTVTVHAETAEKKTIAKKRVK